MSMFYPNSSLSILAVIFFFSEGTTPEALVRELGYQGPTFLLSLDYDTVRESIK